MRYITFFFWYYIFTTYFTFIAYPNLQQPHFKSSVATCCCWLSYWTVQVQNFVQELCYRVILLSVCSIIQSIFKEQIRCMQFKHTSLICPIALFCFQSCLQLTLKFYTTLKEVERFMFFRKVLAIGGNDFPPCFSTTIKMYIEFLLVCLLNVVIAMIVLNPMESYQSKQSLSYIISPCCFKDLPSFQRLKCHFNHLTLPIHALPQGMKFTCM